MSPSAVENQPGVLDVSLGLVLDLMDQGLCLVDSNLDIQVFNRRFVEGLRLPSELCEVGRSLSPLLDHVVERCELSKGYSKQTVLEQLTRLHLSERIKFDATFNDGTVLRVRICPIAGGGFAVNCLDVSETRQGEAALRENEARLQQAVRMANLGHWVWDDIEDRRLYFSEEIAQIEGVSMEELFTKYADREGDMRLVHPDDRERIGSLIAEAERG